MKLSKMQVGRSIGSLLCAVQMISMPAVSSAQISVGLSITIAPPAIPVYEQPICPSPGYMWTPGYWAYDPADGYYFVPGTWVLAPRPGVLWTPGYWGWSGGVFAWNAGYWGPHIGFYGGINYGFGYGGVGYEGGYWNHGAFFYNQSVNHVNTTNITNVYNKTVINNSTTRVSYNGGNGGVAARATPTELAAAREPHVAPTPLQTQHEQAAHSNPAQFASRNHGQPAVAATPKPGVLSGAGVVRATRAGAPYNAAANRAAARPGTPAAAGTHATPAAHPSSAATPAAHGTPPRTATPAGGTRPATVAHSNSPAAARPAAPAGAPHGTPPSKPQPAAHPAAHPAEKPR